MVLGGVYGTRKGFGTNLGAKGMVLGGCCGPTHGFGIGFGDQGIDFGGDMGPGIGFGILGGFWEALELGEWFWERFSWFEDGLGMVLGVLERFGMSFWIGLGLFCGSGLGWEGLQNCRFGVLGMLLGVRPRAGCFWEGVMAQGRVLGWLWGQKGMVLGGRCGPMFVLGRPGGLRLLGAIGLVLGWVYGTRKGLGVDFRALGDDVGAGSGAIGWFL